jgi:hypothetical protein
MNRHEGKFVIVRCDRSGVHFGEFVRTNGKGFVSLRNARRLWQWKGAFTLSRVANAGVDLSGSKLSEALAEQDLQDAIEVCLCSETASRQLREAPEWVPV